jgi:hypothetical protein
LHFQFGAAAGNQVKLIPFSEPGARIGSVVIIGIEAGAWRLVDLIGDAIVQPGILDRLSILVDRDFRFRPDLVVRIGPAMEGAVRKWAISRGFDGSSATELWTGPGVGRMLA